MSELISRAGFREILSQFASGVTVVTARDADGPVGFTATGFTSVSLVPPLILVCINKDASAHEATVASEYFGVSILDESQAWIATQFARSNIDRFVGVALRTPVAARAPLIEGALAQLECKRHALHVAGDHTILVGEVLAGAVGVGRPLLHFSRRFGAFVPEGAVPAKTPASGEPAV